MKPDVLAIVTQGNLATLTEAQRTDYYLALCDALGLDPRFRPVDFIESQGRVVAYLNRGATDALARREGIQRDIVSRPQVVSIDTVKVVECVASATDRNGRSETRTGTLILKDHATVFMKCETKAIRRATIASLGIGMLDESELSGIRGADALANAARGAALEAHAVAVFDTIASVLPTLASASREQKQAVWNPAVKLLAENASVTLKEAHNALAARLKR